MLLVSLMLMAVCAPLALAQNSLPKDAEFMGEGFGWKAYVTETGAKSPDGVPQKQLWLRDNNGKVASVLTTSLKFKPLKWEKASVQPLASIMTVDDVEFVMNRDDQKVYAVVQGCPDERNIYTYLIQASLAPKTALFLPAAEGYIGYNVTDNTLNCMTYAYDPEDGRYSVLQVFDFKGNLLEAKRVADDAEADGRGIDEEDEDGDDECEGDCEEHDYINGYILKNEILNMSFKVKGGVGIKQFVSALEPFDDDFWRYCEPTLDQPNGYFDWGDEGDGSVRYNAAYWNCKDGAKLFIISWRQCENYYFPQEDKERFGTTGMTGSNFKYEVVGIDNPDNVNDGMISCYGFDTGYIVYIYSEDTKMLTPLRFAPFSGMPETNAHRYLELPRKGKDIKVHEIVYKDNGDFDEEIHTLKWNGISFDYNK